jgi:glycosyltransferase involved in cell wall biosynthesis
MYWCQIRKGLADLGRLEKQASMTLPTTDCKTSLRVLHLIGQLGRGGCELQLTGMVEQLAAQGLRAQHTILCFWDDADPEIRQRLASAGIEVVFMHKGRGIDAGFSKRLAGFLRANVDRFDVMHAWLMSAGLWGRLALRKLGKRRPATVVSYRSAEPHHWPGGAMLDRFLARYCELYICNSQAVQDVWAQRLRLDKAFLPVIANGVDAARFDPAQYDRFSVRQRLRVPADAVVITQVGTFKPAKNWPLFLEIAADICRREPSAIFLAVGHGPLFDDVQVMLERYEDVADRIRFLGQREDIPELLAASDIVLSTSDVEGMPNAILEAMAAGKPVVATKISGSEELVRPGQTGTFFSVGDVAGATQALLELIEDVDLRIRYSEAARKIACDVYSFSSMAEAHCRAYEQAFARRKNQ